MVLLGSCTKNKTVHFEGIMTSNTNIYLFRLLFNEESTYIESSNLYLGFDLGNVFTQTPIPVGKYVNPASNIMQKKVISSVQY